MPEAFEHRLGMAMRYAIAEAEMKQAVAEGKITEKEARAKLAATRKMMAGQGEREDGMKRRIAAALSKAGIDRERSRDVMGAMRKIMAEVQSEGDAFELDPRMLAHLEELGLTGEQITLVVGLSHRVADTQADSNRGRGNRRARPINSSPALIRSRPVSQPLSVTSSARNLKFAGQQVFLRCLADDASNLHVGVGVARLTFHRPCYALRPRHASEPE